MTLVAGSYDRYIWGYSFKPHAQTLIQLFSYQSHLSPIKSAVVAGPVAASSAGDDSIKLYDLSAFSEIASFQDRPSSASSLVFFTPPSLSFPRNLLAAYDDGSVSIYDADPFVLLKTLPVHKRGINDMTVHPSGRLALTVGRDSSFSMVNLVRGKRSFYCKLGKEATLVKFGLDGERFFMVSEETVGVHETEDARLACEFEIKKRVLCAAPGENGILFTGGEDRSITAWDRSSGKAAYSIEDAHAFRVKGIVVLSKNDCTSSEDPYFLASASSDGVIRVWDVRMAAKEKASPLVEANTKSRLTCLAGSSIKSALKKQHPGSTQRKEGKGTAGRSRLKD